jgi:hypothetical protein
LWLQVGTVSQRPLALEELKLDTWVPEAGLGSKDLGNLTRPSNLNYPSLGELLQLHLVGHLGRDWAEVVIALLEQADLKLAKDKVQIQVRGHLVGMVSPPLDLTEDPKGLHRGGDLPDKAKRGPGRLHVLICRGHCVQETGFMRVEVSRVAVQARLNTDAPGAAFREPVLTEACIAAAAGTG